MGVAPLFHGEVQNCTSAVVSSCIKKGWKFAVLVGHLERCVEGVNMYTKAEASTMQQHKHTFGRAVIPSQLCQCFSIYKLLSFLYIYIVGSLQRYSN